MKTARISRGCRLCLLAWTALLLAAWGLWLYQLDASDLTFDESATDFVARRPLGEMLSYLTQASREHPPLYYVLIHGWMAVAGRSEFSLRFFSVGCGLVVLVLIGWVARCGLWQAQGAVVGRRPLSGLIPALLLAATPGMAYFARDARMYPLTMAWVLLSAGLFLRDWLPANRWPGRAALVALPAVHLLALLTHYYLLLPILVQPLALLVCRRWRPLAAWLAVHLVPALGGLVWFYLASGLQATTAGLWRDIALTLPTRFQAFHLLGKVLFGPAMRVWFRLLYVLLTLAGLGLLIGLLRRQVAALWLLLALLVPFLLAFQLPQPPAERYLLFMAPLIVLALGGLVTFPLRWGCGRIVSLLLAVGMAGLLAAGGLWPTVTFDRSHYGRTLETVRAYSRPGDAILFYGPWQWIPFQYYDPGGLPPITLLPPQAPPLLSPDEARPVLEGLLARYGRLWVLPAAVDSVDPAHFAEGWLRTHAHAVWDTVDFSLYLPPLPADAPARAVGITFGERLRLERVAWEPQPTAGEPLRVTLYWRPLRPLEGDVRLALQWVDARGYVWLQAEPLPGAWAYPPSHWQPDETVTDYEGLMVPPGAPPGEYTLRLAVTDVATGEALPVGDGTAADLFSVSLSDPLPGAPSAGMANLLYLPLVAVETAGDGQTAAAPAPGMTAFCAPSGAPCVTLAAVEPGGRRFQPGYPIPLRLHWRSPTTPLPELSLRLRVEHRPWLALSGLQATLIVSKTQSIIPGYPAPQWFPGRLVTLVTSISLPPDARTGPARVTLEVLGPDGVSWATTDGLTRLPLFDLTVEPRPVLRRMPRGYTPTQVDFGAEISLRGYRVEGEARPGGTLRLDYVWHARSRPAAIYAVFNHLLTADGQPVTQADGWPQGGRMLTTQWQPGEYIEDTYTMVIPADAPPGPYLLVTGLYDALSGDRLPAFRDGQRLPEDRWPVPLEERP